MPACVSADDAAYGPFIPHGDGFRCFPILENNDQSGKRSQEGKVGIDDIFFRFEQHIALGNVNQMSMTDKQNSVVRRNGGEQAVASPGACDGVFNHLALHDAVMLVSAV